MRCILSVPGMPGQVAGGSNHALAPGFESRSAQSHLSSFHKSSWAGSVQGLWWFRRYELHVYSSSVSESEAQSEYVVVTD
jgi:hypothetical protein